MGIKMVITSIVIVIGNQEEYNDGHMGGNQHPLGAVSARSGHNRNPYGSQPSISDSVQNGIIHNTPQARRHLPVHDRENVFNEWGAVIKHQDEIDRELKKQRDHKLRERQQNYKMQLDLQYNEHMNKKKGALSDQARKEDDIMKVYEKGVEGKRRLEDEKKSQMVTQQKTAAYQSINELSTMKKQQQSIREMEKQLYYNKLKQQEEMENQRKLDDKEKYKIDQGNYSRILAMQHKSKVDKLHDEKAQNWHFSEAERVQLNRQEEDRGKFFTKLNDIQKFNDIKQKKLVEYMEKDPKEMRSKQDEQNYMRNLEDAEKKNVIMDYEKASKKQNDQIRNYRSLAVQMQERNVQSVNVKAQEHAIGNHYMREADKFRQELEDDKVKKQRSKEEYNKALAGQIKDNKKKKQYSVLMTDHERRVNDKDIKAYEDLDTTNLYAKVPGFGGDNRLDKYTDKSLSRANIMDHLPENNGNGSNLANAGKRMVLTRSTNILTNVEEPPRMMGDYYSPLKLERVRENMETEDAVSKKQHTLYIY
jgi:hypothetical protein